MELKQLNKIVVLLALAISMNIFSQMKMTSIDGKKLNINSKTEKRNIITIFDDNDYSVFYILDRRDFDFKKGLGVSGRANIIFFSKTYKKGIVSNFEQMIYHVNKNVYNISLHIDKNLLVPEMMILDKELNYEYFMRSYYILPPPPTQSTVYQSSITIQDYKNLCNLKKVSLSKIFVEEDLNNIFKILNTETITSTNCSPIFQTINLRDLFPEKIIK